MRIGLLDPRWVEQRDKHISDKMNQESVYAPGNFINLPFGSVIFVFFSNLELKIAYSIVLLKQILVLS